MIEIHKFLSLLSISFGFEDYITKINFVTLFQFVPGPQRTRRGVKGTFIGTFTGIESPKRHSGWLTDLFTLSATAHSSKIGL